MAREEGLSYNHRISSKLLFYNDERTQNVGVLDSKFKSYKNKEHPKYIYTNVVSIIDPRRKHNTIME